MGVGWEVSSSRASTSVRLSHVLVAKTYMVLSLQITNIFKVCDSKRVLPGMVLSDPHRHWVQWVTVCSLVSRREKHPPPEGRSGQFTRFQLSSGPCGRVIVLWTLMVSLAIRDPMARVMWPEMKSQVMGWQVVGGGECYVAGSFTPGLLTPSRGQTVAHDVGSLLRLSDWRLAGSQSWF